MKEHIIIEIENEATVENINKMIEDIIETNKNNYNLMNIEQKTDDKGLHIYTKIRYSLKENKNLYQ